MAGGACTVIRIHSIQNNSTSYTDTVEIEATETELVQPGDTIEAVIAEYRAENEHARRVTDATPSLDQLSARAVEMRGHFSLRWVLVHILEETARHAGHLDVMRESLDGATGD